MIIRVLERIRGLETGVVNPGTNASNFDSHMCHEKDEEGSFPLFSQGTGVSPGFHEHPVTRKEGMQRVIQSQMIEGLDNLGNGGDILRKRVDIVPEGLVPKGRKGCGHGSMIKI